MEGIFAQIGRREVFVERQTSALSLEHCLQKKLANGQGEGVRPRLRKYLHPTDRSLDHLSKQPKPSFASLHFALCIMHFDIKVFLTMARRSATPGIETSTDQKAGADERLDRVIAFLIRSELGRGKIIWTAASYHNVSHMHCPPVGKCSIFRFLPNHTRCPII